MKIDFKRTLPAYSAERGKFQIVDVPPLQYLMVDGSGDPNTAQEYRDAVGALYPLAYSLKFASKGLDKDYVVMPLEALWWAADMDSFTSDRDKSKWNWTAMIMVPDWIDAAMFDAAVSSSRKKNPPDALDQIRLSGLSEGRCVQILHIGPYDDEAETLARMHDEYIPDAGLTMTGKHHEIYLSDPRRVEPARLRTILRQPVE